jgi:APA family basic amino acid/polyamine antiporter
VTAEPSGAPVLRRELGLLDLSVAGVGIIMGAGIFVLLGAATARAGPLVWASFIVAGAASACTALSYAELAAMYPRAGASFEFARQAFGMRVAFMTGWLAVNAEVIAAAAVALGFGAYAHALFGVDGRIAAWVLLGAGIAIASTGALRSVGVAVTLTVIEICGLFAVSAIGFTDFHPGNLHGTGDVSMVLGGAALVFFAYIGFEDLATFAEEARDPGRTVPRAILISMVASTAIYIMVAVASVGALGAQQLGASSAPIELVARIVLGSRAGDVLAAIALAATAKTTLLLLMASSRRIYGMATDGALPAALARVSGHTRAPVTGIAIVAGFAALVATSGSIGAVAGVTNFALFIAFGVVNASAVWLRRRAPAAARPFRSPGTLPVPGLRWVPLLPVLGIATAVGLIASLDRASLLGGAAVIVLGLVLAFVFRELHRAPRVPWPRRRR